MASVLAVWREKCFQSFTPFRLANFAINATLDLPLRHMWVMMTREYSPREEESGASMVQIHWRHKGNSYQTNILQRLEKLMCPIFDMPLPHQEPNDDVVGYNSLRF